VVLSGLFLATPALAQQGGGYVGAGFVSASTNNASDFASAFVVNGSANKSATGLKVYGGYLWGRYGLEAGYYDLGTYDVKSGGVKTDKFKTSAITVSGVGSLPLGNAFNLNGKLGLAFTSADYTCVLGCGGAIFVNTSKSGVSLLLGGGLGWQATKSFSLRGDLEFFNNVQHAAGIAKNDASYTTLSVSGQYNF
jgi:hypothetical protein